MFLLQHDLSWFTQGLKPCLDKVTSFRKVLLAWFSWQKILKFSLEPRQHGLRVPQFLPLFAIPSKDFVKFLPSSILPPILLMWLNNTIMPINSSTKGVNIIHTYNNTYMWTKGDEFSGRCSKSPSCGSVKMYIEIWKIMQRNVRSLE